MGKMKNGKDNPLDRKRQIEQCASHRNPWAHPCVSEGCAVPVTVMVCVVLLMWKSDNK